MEMMARGVATSGAFDVQPLGRRFNSRYGASPHNNSLSAAGKFLQIIILSQLFYGSKSGGDLRLGSAGLVKCNDNL